MDTNTSDFAALGAPLGLQATLEQQVDSEGNPLAFTLLAPSNDALAMLTQEQRDALASDPNRARELIDYHFVDQALTSELLLASTGGQVLTRSGDALLIEIIDNEVIFNGVSRISQDNLRAENGRVLVIDTVLPLEVPEGRTITEEEVAVSYTHLTLPTIYSV